MKYVKKVKRVVTGFIFTLSFCLSTVSASAGDAKVGVDGFNQIVAVWHESDPSTGFLKILATYGTGSLTSVNLTNPASFHAFDPDLAISKAGLLTPINAAAIWKAYDLNTGDQVIQVAVASGGSWTGNSGVTVSDPTNEIPQNEYHVSISSDSAIIGIVWTSYMISTGDVVIRHAYSNDNGTTWNGPYTL